MKKQKSWKDLSAGAILEGGTATEYHTGEWRSFKPIFHAERCIQCFICWIYCPDASIKVEKEKVVGIDMDYCKGCAICAEVCPPKANAITMEKEAK